MVAYMKDISRLTEELKIIIVHYNIKGFGYDVFCITT